MARISGEGPSGEGTVTTRDERPRGPAPPAAPSSAPPAAEATGPPAPPSPPPTPQRQQAQPRLSRPSAVLDEAHLGDIEGALGRIRLSEEDTERRGFKRKLITFLAIIGPGLIVMVGDNDAGGVSTYAQAGQNYGYTLLWTLLLLVPVLIVNQEMVVRLGAVTGVGHARLINERFGKFWGWFSVGDLFILNFLTITTEFIGVSLALQYFHVSPYISVPIAGAVLIGITMSGSFARWERSMFAFIAVSLILVPLFFTSHPDWGQIGYHFVVPGIQGGANSTAVLLIIAIVGTTVAPWQLFFQQSNVIDKRITPRFIGYERADTTLGAFVVVISAAMILVVAVFAVQGTHLAGQFTNALGVARILETHGQWYGAAFSVVLLDASIIGASAVTLSTSYAFGDVFGIKHSLHRKFREAKPFYATYAGMIVAAATIVLIPGTPLGLLTTAVQALAGILLPSASVFLLLLCNDREVLGPWMNPRWLNVLASLIIGVLLVLSGTLVVGTLFSNLNATTVAIWIAIALVALAILAGVWFWLTRNRRPPPEPHPRTTMTEAERMAWRMPPIALLKSAEWSTGRKVALLTLRGYLVISVLLLIVKAVKLGGG
jgi:NRAMP (natural resistance-associated macrophage protein)-like metal ion transporter